MRIGSILLGAAVIAAAGLSVWAWRASTSNGAATRPAAQTSAPPATNAARVPVVVELFTSEGCSSCPPADEVLQELERTQPVAGAEIIPLSLHVDYWNYIGWADPFSSAAYSQRQNDYAAAFGRGRIYTPQMVVDGRAEFVGSEENRARRSIAEAAQQPKAAVTLQRQDGKDGQPALSVKVEKIPAVSAGDEAEVVLAVTESGLRSSVARGENAGRRLTHTAVVRQLTTLGTAREGFQASPSLAPDKAWQRSNLRAVVLVQERRRRRILGAATVPLN